MQQNIQPKFHDEAQITCTACGKVYTIGSTKDNITVEVCSNCHPFYTGEHRFLDTKGTVDKFLKREKEAKQYKKQMTAKKQSTQDKQEKKTKSLRELLGEI